MEKRYRDVGGYDGLGERRYKRYCGAFDWVVHCVDAGYFLEAIAVLDSIIWDRLSSRLGYLSGARVDDRDTLAKICTGLVGASGEGGFERETSFRDVELQIKQWGESGIMRCTRQPRYSATRLQTRTSVRYHSCIKRLQKKVFATSKHLTGLIQQADKKLGRCRGVAQMHSFPSGGLESRSYLSGGERADSDDWRLTTRTHGLRVRIFRMSPQKTVGVYESFSFHMAGKRPVRLSEADRGMEATVCASEVHGERQLREAMTF